MKMKPTDIIHVALKEKGHTTVAEHCFDTNRKWRFDLALPDVKVAIEIEGVTTEGGRHQRTKGYTNDCYKYNRAQILGWIVLRYTPKMVTHDTDNCIRQIRMAIKLSSP